MNSDSRGSPAWNSVWPAGTFNSSTTLARATRSSSLRSSNILMLARKLGSQGIGFFSPERKRSIKERRHYSLCRLKKSAGIEQSSQAKRSANHTKRNSWFLFSGSFLSRGTKARNQAGHH